MELQVQTDVKDTRNQCITISLSTFTVVSFVLVISFWQRRGIYKQFWRGIYKQFNTSVPCAQDILVLQQRQSGKRFCSHFRTKPTANRTTEVYRLQNMSSSVSKCSIRSSSHHIVRVTITSTTVPPFVVSSPCTLHVAASSACLRSVGYLLDSTMW
jgi:hypothetical protein